MKRLAFIAIGLYGAVWAVAALEQPIYHCCYSGAVERIYDAVRGW